MSTAARLLLRVWPALLAPLAGAACGDDPRAPEPVAIDRFEADPPAVPRGSTTTLRWSLTGARAVRVVDDAGRILLDDEAPEPQGTLETGGLPSSTRFTLEALGAAVDDRARAELEVRVRVPAPVFTETEVVPSTILAGQAAALRWSADDAVVVDVATSTGAVVLEDGPTTGEVVVRPRGSRTYVLTARGPQTDATAMLTVSVGNRPPTIERFVASPPAIAPGQATSLAWRVIGADRITVENTRTASVVSDGGAPAGSRTLSLDATTEFLLTATGPGGESTARATVRVAEPAPLRFDRLAVTPNPSPRGATPELSWAIRGAQRVEVRSGGAVLLRNGPRAGRLPLTLAREVTELAVTATGAAGSATRAVTAFVHDPPSIRSFGVAPRARASAGSVTLSWDAQPVFGLEARVDDAPVPGFPAVTATVGAQGASMGSFTVTATRTATFTLEATTAAGATEAAALFVLGVEEVEPNDRLDQALAPAPAGALRDHLGRIAGGDVDLWAVGVPDGGSVVAETSSGPGRCDVDTKIALRDGAGTILVEDDDSGRGDCSALGPSLQPETGRLAGGTYYVQVESASGGTYVLSLGAGPQLCGDGRRDPPESCDDGNRTSGDGCSRSCALEVGGPTLSAPGGQVDLGSVPGGSSRVLRLTIASPGQSVTATAADPGGGCATVDTGLALIADTGAVLAAAPGGGPSGAAGTCGTLDPRANAGAADLRPGSYFLRVDNEGAASGPVQVVYRVDDPACGNGLLESRAGEQCDDGNTRSGDGCSSACALEGGAVPEREPNDRQASATPSGLLGLGRVQLRGEIRPSGDDDVFSLEVPAGQAVQLRARTYTLRGRPRSCDRVVTDTRIFLEEAGREAFAPGQGELAFDDDLDPAQNVWCSEVTQVPLAGGPRGRTYYLRGQGGRDRGLATYFVDLELSP